MSKPDWNDAPKWANYVAMDESGEWWWFENEPSPGRDEWKVDAGDVDAAALSFENWKDTLEKRP